MMFSESRNDRHRPPPMASGIVTTLQGLAITSQKLSMTPRDRQYRHESDLMLNSVLNVDFSNSVTGRQFPKGWANSHRF